MMVLVLEDDFELILVTFLWWQPSTTLLMIVPIQISALIPASSTFSGSSCTASSSGLDNFHTWDCSCEHSPGCIRTFGCGECPSMQQSGLSLPFVWCAFFMTSFHSFSIVAFASGINIAWVKDLLFILLGFPRHASLRDRFWTMRNSRFPKFADQNHIRSSYFFLPRFTLESISYSPVFLRLLEEYCLTDTLCRETRQRVLAFTFKGN